MSPFVVENANFGTFLEKFLAEIGKISSFAPFAPAKTCLISVTSNLRGGGKRVLGVAVAKLVFDG